MSSQPDVLCMVDMNEGGGRAVLLSTRELTSCFTIMQQPLTPFAAEWASLITKWCEYFLSFLPANFTPEKRLMLTTLNFSVRGQESPILTYH